MSNMSYCRFQNTSSNLQDCVDQLDKMLDDCGGADTHYKDLSQDESSKAEQMREQCETYIRLFDEVMEQVEDAEVK